MLSFHLSLLQSPRNNAGMKTVRVRHHLTLPILCHSHPLAACGNADSGLRGLGTASVSAYLASLWPWYVQSALKHNAVVLIWTSLEFIM